MRKTGFHLFGRVAAKMWVVCLWGLAACVNHIPGAGSGEGESDVEVFFMAEIEPAGTRMTGDAFEKGDEMGLFATTPRGSLSTSRYADNFLMTYQGDGTLLAQQTLYFPEDEVPMDIFCYFPYQKEGIPAGTSQLPVKVEADQRDDEAFERSDFLAAQVKGVTAEDGAIRLTFKHKLAHIKVALMPSEGLTADGILALDPQVAAVNFYTEGMYEPESDWFTGLKAERDIVAHGTWTKSGNKLVGKEIIVLPQDIGNLGRSLILEVGESVLTCNLGEGTLSSGNTQDLTISVTPTSTGLVGSITGDVDGWENGKPLEATTTQKNKAVHTSVFSFSKSNGYRVWYQNEVVAEVWREFLCSGAGTGVQALVAYPVKNGACDLQNGLLLHYYDSAEADCGGKISWKSDGSGYTYTGGNLPPVQTFYVASDGRLSVEEPADAVSVNVGCYSLIDYRDNNKTEYPLTKIGTQFWMAADLCAKSFADGGKLEAEKIIGTEKKQCYFKAEGTPLYFYNGETLMNGELAPEGFRLPSSDDWTQLRNYLHQDVSVLKTGTWKQVKDSSKEVEPATNLTWFGGYPAGMWTNEHKLYNQVAAYYSWDYTQDKPDDNLVMMYGEEPDFVLSIDSYNQNGEYKGASVRCLRK